MIKILGKCILFSVWICIYLLKRGEFWWVYTVYRVIPSPLVSLLNPPDVHYGQINDAKPKGLRGPFRQNHCVGKLFRIYPFHLSMSFEVPKAKHGEKSTSLKFLDLKSETRARIFDIIFSSGQSGLFWNPYLKCQTSVQFLFLCVPQSVLCVSVCPSQYWLFQTPRNARWQLLTAEEIKLLWCVRFQSLLYFYFDRFFLKLSSTCCGGELYLYLYL